MVASTPIAVADESEQVAALTDPARRRVLGALSAGDSAAGVARRLGEPRQRINYHLRELERVGLVRLIDERRKGNCTERVFRAIADRFVPSAAAFGELGDLDAAPSADRFAWARLVALAARVITDLAALRGRADRAGKALQTFSFELEVCAASPGDLAALVDEITDAVAGAVARRHDPSASGGRTFRLVFGAYPAVARDGGRGGSDTVKGGSA